MESKERLREIIDDIKYRENLTNEELAERLKYGPTYISDILGGKKINDKFLGRLSEYYQVNPDYILTGAGTAYSRKVDYQEERRTVKLRDYPKVPFYDADATASDITVDMTPISAPSGAIDVGDLLRDSRAALRVYGNSMIPNYPPGCVVGLVPSTDSFIEPGEVYVIETRDRRLLKRLFYKNDDTNSDYLTCYSDNIMLFEGGARHGRLAYPPFDLPKKEITKMFVVTGVIKRNTNSVIINKN